MAMKKSELINLAAEWLKSKEAADAFQKKLKSIDAKTTRKNIEGCLEIIGQAADEIAQDFD